MVMKRKVVSRKWRRLARTQTAGKTQIQHRKFRNRGARGWGTVDREQGIGYRYAKLVPQYIEPSNENAISRCIRLIF
jgi:hypothetical protein